jgi:hypothetical protein
VRFVDPRSRWILFVIGGLLALWGLEEFRVGFDAAAEAIEVDLAALEQGQKLPQNHIRLGTHMCLYFDAIYSYDLRDKNKPNPDIQYAYYPIISLSNPLLSRLTPHVNPDEDSSPAQHVEELKVLVKTQQFKRVSDIPRDGVVKKAVTGLVINRIRSLEVKEADLLRQQYPRINLEQILILEESRTPISPAVSFAVLAGGLALVALALVCYLLDRTGRKATQ